MELTFFCQENMKKVKIETFTETKVDWLKERVLTELLFKWIFLSLNSQSCSPRVVVSLLFLKRC